MRCFTNFLVVFLLFISSLAVSCSSSGDVIVKSEDDKIINEPNIDDVVGGNIVSISTAQTTVALIESKDIDIPFSINLIRLATSDVNIKLEIQTDCKEGTEYVLKDVLVSIKGGEKLYEGVVSLKTNGFRFDEKKSINIKLSTSDVAIDDKKAEITISIDKPSLVRPGIEYVKPTYSFACTAYCSRFSIGGISFEKLFENQSAYEDLSSAYVACVNIGENIALIETDRASANAEWAIYKYKIVLWGDWNGDGDFDDQGEQCVSESWIQGDDQYVTHNLKFKVPEDAVRSAVIRMGIYEDTDKSTNMRYGAGNMDNGNLKDIAYLLVDTPVALKPLDEADKPIYSDYCKTVEFFYSYAEIRTFQLNGKTIRESTKGDPLETDTEKHDDMWDAWGSRVKLNYIQKLKRGEQNIFEFTAERHIDIATCDQRYRAMIYIDWNGDKDFCDDGEEILQEEWFAEWLATSHPKQFLGYLTPPADAVKQSRIRFGVYANRQSYIRGGCGGGNNTDIIDILYELEN